MMTLKMTNAEIITVVNRTYWPPRLAAIRDYCASLLAKATALASSRILYSRISLSSSTKLGGKLG